MTAIICLLLIPLLLIPRSGIRKLCPGKRYPEKYPVSEDEGEEDNTYLSYNMVVGEAADINLSLAFEVLDYALLSAPGAPLKQALLDAKIGKGYLWFF